MKLLCFVFFLFMLCFAVNAALLGIDYGQDFLKSALVAPNIPFEIVLTLETKRKEPMSVALKEVAGSKNEFERFYGAASTPVCSRFPDTCITNLKGLLGQSFSNKTLVDSFVSKHAGAEVLGNKKRSTIDFKVSKDGIFQIEEINAMFIAQIRERAQKMLKQETGSSYLTDVVITVPSYFTQGQRIALINSAKVAGFSAVSLVDDGLAVAVNYASNNIKFDPSNKQEKQHHLIYDMGAGSTKATVLSFQQGEKSSVSTIEVQGYSADQSLGGEHFTNSIFELLKTKAVDLTSISKDALNKNKKSLVKLWQAAEKAKLILSANNEASTSIESLFDDIDFKATVTRQEFEDANSGVADRIIEPIINSLKQPLDPQAKSIDLSNLNSVILFGGSTRIPLVQKTLSDLLGKELMSKNVNADEAAVQGATLRGVMLTKIFRAKDINITERAIYDYSISYATNESKQASRQVSVFPRGSTYDDLVKVELADLENSDSDFEIKLYENGDLLETDTFKSVKSEIKKSVEKLSKDFDLSQCKEQNGLKYYAFFKLDQNKLFMIKNVTVSCDASSSDKKGFFQNILKGKTEEKIDNDESNNNSNSSANSSTKAKASVKSKTLKHSLPISREYPSLKQLSTMQRDTSERKLRELTYKDQVRFQKLELLNSLESELYSIRSELDDTELEIEEGNKDTHFSKADLKNLKAFKKLVTEYLEWLEDQTYSRNLNDLKTSVINSRIEKLKIISTYLSSPISVSKFEILGSNVKVMNNNLKEFAQKLEKESETLVKVYNSKNFSREVFEKDSKKISKTALLKFEELNIEKESLSLVESLEKIESTIKNIKESEEIDIDEDEITALEAEKTIDQFQLYVNTINKLDELKKLLGKLEKEQKRRYKLFEKMLETKIKKRNQKIESKKNATESINTINSSATETEVDKTTVPIKSNTEATVSQEIENDSSTDAPEHDEL